MPICSRRGEKHEVNPSPMVRGALLVLLLLTASFAVAQEQPANPPAPTPTQAPTGPEASSSAPEAAAQGSAPLRVMVGKSLLINTTERLKRVSVTDDAVADVMVVTPTQILVHGRVRGRSFLADLGRTRALAQLRLARGCGRQRRGRGREAGLPRGADQRLPLRVPPLCFPATFLPRTLPSAPA